jgi:hypothetical protein
LLGDLISVRALGKLSVIVNSAEAAKEIFGKRASIYSDRPSLKMLEMCASVCPNEADSRLMYSAKDGMGLEFGAYAVRRAMAQAAPLFTPSFSLWRSLRAFSGASCQREQACRASARQT